MRQDKLSKSSFILYAFLLVPVIWSALLVAPCLGGNLLSILEKLVGAVNEPFHIIKTENTVRCVIFFVAAYLLGLGIYISVAKNYRHGEEHGSATWGRAATICRKYKQKGFNNLLLSKKVKFGLNMFKHLKNLNVLVVGGSGSGKSRFYCLPNLMQANTSFVCLDPRGELLKTTGHLLKKKGYKVKVLDLFDMSKSFCYNPFVYIHDDNDIQRLITNLFKNTTPKGSKANDPFWDNMAMMLLKALVFYLYYEAPDDEKNFPMVMEMLRAADVKEDDENYQSAVDVLFSRLETKNPYHIAVKYYKDYRGAPARTIKNIQNSLSSHLEKFNLPSVADLTMTDDLELEKIGLEKTALFAVIPDDDDSYNFIVGVLYTQLFQTLYGQAHKQKNGKLPIQVHFLMDEFANVALPDNFENIVATCRARKVSVSIVLQNLSQLKALFKDSWESIVGNCDTFLYLGGNESSTFEHVTKLLGKETIDTNTFGKNQGKNGSYSTNYQNTGRDLMDISEMRRLDNKFCILFIRGELPIFDLKYDVKKHPNVKHTTIAGEKDYDHGSTSSEIARIDFDNLDIKDAVEIKINENDCVLCTDEDDINDFIQEIEKNNK